MTRSTNGARILTALESGQSTVILTFHDENDVPIFRETDTIVAAREYVAKSNNIAPVNRTDITAVVTRSRAEQMASLIG